MHRTGRSSSQATPCQSNRSPLRVDLPPVADQHDTRHPSARHTTTDLPSRCTKPMSAHPIFVGATPTELLVRCRRAPGPSSARTVTKHDGPSSRAPPTLRVWADGGVSSGAPKPGPAGLTIIVVPSDREFDQGGKTAGRLADEMNVGHSRRPARSARPDPATQASIGWRRQAVHNGVLSTADRRQRIPVIATIAPGRLEAHPL